MTDDVAVDTAAMVAQPTVDGLTDALQCALGGDALDADPTTAVERYDWDTVTTQAESNYQRAIDNQW